VTVIGEAVVAIAPESGGFVSGLEKQLQAANFLGPGALIGSALVAGLVVSLAKIGEAFEASKVQIQRETGETGAALNATFNTVKDVMKTVPDSIGTVTTAVDELVRRGVPLGATFDKLAQQTLELAKITKSDLGATVQDTTQIMARFNVPLSQQPAMLDQIFKGYQASGKSLSEFTGSLASGAVFLQQFGFTLSSSTALIAALDKAGVNVSTTLAGLRKAFGVIAKEGGDPQTVLAGIVKEFSDGTPKAQAMADAMKLFGARSGAELATAIQSGKFSVDGLLKSITDGKGGILATADSTRTLGEQLDILKNQALVALEPLGTAVWTGIRDAFTQTVGPVTDLATAFGHLLVQLEPIGVAVGVLVAVGFKVLLDAISLVATGLAGLASFLSHFPAPVLIAAAAIAVMVKAFLALKELGSVVAVIDALRASTVAFALDSGIGVLVLGLVALGAVLKIFGSSESAVAKESKDLTAALFDTGNTAGIFANGITSAAQGLTKFLTDQDAKGKLKDLDNALQGSGQSLGDVATAVTGSRAAFNAFTQTIADTHGITAWQEAVGKMSNAQLDAAIATGKANVADIEAGNRYNSLTKAITDQYNALLLSTDQDLKGAATAGQLTQSQAAYAESLLHSTGALGGITAATNFANAAAEGNAAALVKQQLAAATASGSMAQLKSEIIDGTFSTTNAADAAAKFGLDLDATKQIISDTTAALKTFVSQGLAGFDTGNTPVTDWEKNITTAFTNVANAAKQGPAAVAAAHAALVKALDPSDVVRQVQAESAQIATFSSNIQALVGKFPDAVRALLANPDKQAAAAYAQALLNNPKVAEQYNAAQHKLQTTLGGMSAFLSGPGAQDLLTGGVDAGDSINTGLNTGLSGGGGAAPTPAHSVRVWIDGVSKSITTNTPSIQTTAKTTAATVAGSYGAALTLPAKTTDALAGANAVIAKETALYGVSQNLGAGVGVAFLAGIESGMQNGRLLAGINAAATGAVAGAVAAARKAAGISSPSTEGIDIGHQFIAGIAIGLSHLDPVLTASKGIGTALVSSTNGISSTLPTGGSSFGGTSQITLDLTVHLTDGTIVKAQPVTVAVPRSTMQQRVAAEVTAQ
jgi:hypothetical protein